MEILYFFNTCIFKWAQSVFDNKKFAKTPLSCTRCVTLSSFRPISHRPLKCRNLQNPSSVKLCEGKHWLEDWSPSPRLLKYSSDSLRACLLIVIHGAGERSERRRKAEGWERGKRRRNWGVERCSLCACQLIVKHEALGGREETAEDREGSEERRCLNSLRAESQGMDHAQKQRWGRGRDRGREGEREQDRKREIKIERE